VREATGIDFTSTNTDFKVLVMVEQVLISGDDSELYGGNTTTINDYDFAVQFSLRNRVANGLTDCAI
jgi:hypothetical protein